MPVEFSKFAEVCGCKGFRVEEPNDLRDLLSKALSTKGPVVVDVVTSADQLPLFKLVYLVCCL
ncbi:MAG TPA: hypothetical protein EYP20_01130 [Aigarchaeota archaeon]|nr:hypothetical protein [Aigarchaeota archaeon]